MPMHDMPGQTAHAVTANGRLGVMPRPKPQGLTLEVGGHSEVKGPTS